MLHTTYYLTMDNASRTGGKLKDAASKTTARLSFAFCASLALLALTAAAAEFTSDPVFLFVNPDTSSFWRTAPGQTVTVPVDFPDGVTAATLLVEGLSYSKSYEIVRDAGSSSKDFTFDLPAATKPETEDVYTLTLSFDGSDVAKSARIALIQGLSPDAEGVTRCIAPQTGKAWGKAKGRAVMPIPYGTTSFKVDGVERPTGLGGAQGWYALDGLTYGNNAALKLVADGVEYDAVLLGGPGGLLFFVR